MAIHPPANGRQPGMPVRGRSYVQTRTLAFGHGVVSTKRIAPGAYEVDFSKPVTKCAFSATLGNDRASNNFSLVGEISVLLGSTGNKNIFVETFDSA